MKIGFVGLGHMGAPIAANLVSAGFQLTVHDLRPAAADHLLALGADWADSPRLLAQDVDTIICSLPGPLQVEAVMLGDEGALAGARSGSTWIDMTTSSPDLLRNLAALAAQKGVDTLDAPVTGAVDGAAAGKSIYFVGGERHVFERHLPVFEAISDKVFHAGPLGAGLAAKLLTNLLWFINAVAIGDALMLGTRAGIPLPKVWEIIKSSAGNSWVAEHDVPAVFRGDYDPSFTLDLCCKDLQLIGDLGRDLDVPLELGSLAEQVFLRAKRQYGSEQGELHVVKLLEDALNTDLRAPGF